MNNSLNEFSRTGLLIGQEALEKLKKSKVAVFGIGGVGGHCAEALVRSGIGSIDLFDNDKVSLTNINRQLIALHSTIGKYKTEVARDRFLDINPSLDVLAINAFITLDNAHEFDFSHYDYVVDAIDTVSGKIAIIKRAKEQNIPVISSMGAGNKLSPFGFKVADISKTQVCPLAKVMRKKLKDMGLKKVKVVYSEEIPQSPYESKESKGTANRPVPGSMAFVPSVAGLSIAGEVILDLIKNKGDD